MERFYSRAPGRVELLGNHTDYNEGLVLSAAINRSIKVEGEVTGNDTITITSSVVAGLVRASFNAHAPLEDPDAWANFVLGVAHVLKQKSYPIGGFNVHIDGNLPAGD